jgi:signal transduction histidine kinase
LDLNDFYEKNDTTFRFYDKSAGFFGNEVNQNCIFQDSRENVWVATADNVVMFNPNDLTKSKSTPKLYIEKVFAFDKEFNYTELTETESKINHNYVNITINFTGIYHKAPEQVLFKYELSGYDKSVSPVSKNRSVTYTNLRPGKYTFKLWACNESGVWSNKPLEYTFEIVPAFWQTLLFKILSVLIFIFILIYALRQYYKEKQKRKIQLIKTKIEAQENERNRLAKDLHDGIAGNLTGIKINIENIKNSKKYENLQFIIDDLQNIQTEVRTISHNLHSPMFAVSNVEEILRADIEKLNKSEDFSINFNVFPKIDWDKIKTDIQQQMYLIVKEGIANTIKHAEATNTEIQIVLDKNIFRISVEDNGKGFDSEKIQKGLGITNLVSRVEALKGKIQVNSAVNSGTSINIEIPVS